jgi:hypothetical protein
MLKTILAAALLFLAAPAASYAACSADDAMQKVSDITDVLMPKMSSKPDAASKLMSEMGDVVGTGAVTEATCTKLEDLKVRATKL